MKLNSDTLTTAGGVIIAALTASQPIVAATEGSFHQSDWLKLAMACFFAIQGYLTNRTPKAN